MKEGQVSTDTQEKRIPYLRTGVYSLLVNLLLVGVKLSLSFTTGSLALRADAIHSSVDVFGSIALILGLFIANRKSKGFPYGLYKVENVVALAISLLLFITAYEILSRAIEGGDGSLQYTGWALGVVGALILVPYFFSRYEINVGKRYNSPSLVADGRQFRADILSASIVFFALIGQSFGFPLDRIAAGIIALFIVFSGWSLLTGSMRVLLDASVDADSLAMIRSTIESEPAVSSVKRLTGRNSGRYIFVEAEVALRVTDLHKAHQVSSRLENRIKKDLPTVDRVLIHYEPEVKTRIRYAVPLADPGGEISAHFGESAYFALLDFDIRDSKVVGKEIVANPHAGTEKGRGIKVAQFLLEYKADIVAANEELTGKGPGYALADAGAETLTTSASTLEEFERELLLRWRQGGQSNPEQSRRR